MVLPLLPFIPAGIAALGGAARFAGSPTGQRVVQGGMNLFNRGLTGLQNFVQPTGQMITNQAIARPLTAGTTIPFTMAELAGAISPAPQADVTETDEVSAADIEEMLEKEEDKNKKKKKKKKKKKEEKDEEPSLDMIPMKKGGYAKKKRKRKPYKPSSFVKMKGRKRFI